METRARLQGTVTYVNHRLWFVVNYTVKVVPALPLSPSLAQRK